MSRTILILFETILILRKTIPILSKTTFILSKTLLILSIWYYLFIYFITGLINSKCQLCLLILYGKFYNLEMLAMLADMLLLSYLGQYFSYLKQYLSTPAGHQALTIAFWKFQPPHPGCSGATSWQISNKRTS